MVDVLEEDAIVCGADLGPALCGIDVDDDLRL
jgi:hypothetical protein